MAWCVVRGCPRSGFSLRRRPSGNRQQPRTTYHAVLSRQDFPEVLKRPVKLIFELPPAEHRAAQPRAYSARRPDVFHGDGGRAAAELELEEGFGAAAGAELGPAEGGGGDELDHLDLDLTGAERRTELDGETRAFFERAASLGAAAAGEPVGEAGGVGEQGEHTFDPRADGPGELVGGRTHGRKIRRRSMNRRSDEAAGERA